MSGWRLASASFGLPSLAALTADVVRLCSPTPANHIGRFGNTPAFRTWAGTLPTTISGWTPDSHMKKLLITGASGFLGWNVSNMAAGKWDVFGTVFTHQVKIPRTKAIRVDLTQFREVERAFQNNSYDAVIHAAAASNPEFCQINRTESHKINVQSSVNIARLCADRRIRYVFVSTDLVFDGLNPPYREEDSPCPVSVYGEQKVLAEERILKEYPSSTVCRLPLMFGPAGPVAASFIQPMLMAMRAGQDLQLFVDEFRTPVSAKTAASGLLLALEKVTGIIHLGGRERISRYDFAKLMVEIFHIAGARLNPCKRNDLNLRAPRPRDVSLDSSKAFALGFSPSPLVEELREAALLL